ncbi:hypothetical protein [Saccharothrix variisporea]|uniref:CDP-glycerol:poly(Glycerophosphate) glycerophosphotransferase n=1 Tax=Saccharothrix variisporea TaxID=543527 RepID=A0A495X110_9PSEU|nr:hypothetical protein [Saccharothrix variisporea]RKT67527.1 hypothetical protein DFJ66_0702 [Saccharothrix variisporea]
MGKETWVTERRVLLVIRNLTSFHRLLEVVDGLFAGQRVAVKFTIDKGSEYVGDLRKHLIETGCDVLPWQHAAKIEFDAILAAHAGSALRRLRGPILTIAHGAGYPRIVPETTGSTNSPTGVARSQLVHDGRVIPAKIGLSHEEQYALVARTCPEALENCVVIGDPVADRLRASTALRERYRRALRIRPDERLVLVTSTWGPNSALAAGPDLPQRLLAELPLGGYRVALVQHWNISQAHSRYEVAQQFRDGTRCGLITIPPHRGWQAALLAADLVVGDHGSVTFYGVALGKPLLLASDGGCEVDPASANAEVWRKARALDLDAPLRPQVESALEDGGDPALRAITDRVLGRPGEGKALVHRVLCAMMRMPVPTTPPVEPVEPHRVPPREPVGAQVVTASLRFPRNITLERFPHLLSARRPDTDTAPMLVVDESVVDPTVRHNADIVVRNEVAEDPRGWVKAKLAEHPGAAIAAAATESGSVVGFRDEPAVDVPDVGPSTAACALHHWVSLRRRRPPRKGAALVVHDNDVAHFVPLPARPPTAHAS